MKPRHVPHETGVTRKSLHNARRVATLAGDVNQIRDRGRHARHSALPTLFSILGTLDTLVLLELV